MPTFRLFIVLVLTLTLALGACVGTRDVAGEARGVPYTPEVRETADEWAETGSQAWAEIIAARLSRRMTEVTP